MLTDGNTLLTHLEKQNMGGRELQSLLLSLFVLFTHSSLKFFFSIYLFIYLILCERKPENKKKKVQECANCHSIHVEVSKHNYGSHFLLHVGLGIQLSPLDLFSSSIHGASHLPLLWCYETGSHYITPALFEALILHCSLTRCEVYK